LGVSPQALALNLRLLFAKKLLAETRLPMTDVAFAAGFGSVRRFNSAVLQQFRLPPGALRRHQRRATTNASITLQLHYRPPYDWESAIAVYARHAVPGVESVQDAHYRRNFKLGGAHGSFTVRPLTGRNALQLDLNLSDHSQLMPVVARIRRMFDLDANPAAVDQVLRQDPNLAPLLQQRPGIRCIGHWSLYEAAVRGIAGQQISTQAARKVLATLTTRATQSGSTPTFPGAAALLALPDDAFPMPGRRRDTLRALAQLVTTGEDNLTIETLSALRGVGPWTVAVASLRGSGDPDAWPARDLGLEKAWANLGGHTSTLHDYAARWRPWRGYAANLLWRSLNL
jgi:AraC family transcriptional regulator of adaptative response / DNA-3-methyladenine glycosylase II